VTFVVLKGAFLSGKHRVAVYHSGQMHTRNHGVTSLALIVDEVAMLRNKMIIKKI
jgi:hypothetical protein